MEKEGEKAEEENNVEIHFKNNFSWTSANAYVVNDEGEVLGAWTGKAITENENNKNWFSIEFFSDSDFTIVINCEHSKVDEAHIELEEEGPTRLWTKEVLTSSEPDENGIYHYELEISTEEPRGWEDTGVKGTGEEWAYNILEDGTVEITDYLAAEYDVIVPPRIDGYNVSSIGVTGFKKATLYKFRIKAYKSYGKTNLYRDM